MGHGGDGGRGHAVRAWPGGPGRAVCACRGGEGEGETGARSRTARGCGALCQRVDVGGCDDGGEEEEGEGAVRDDRSERGGQAQSEQWCGGPEEQPAATWCG